MSCEPQPSPGTRVVHSLFEENTVLLSVLNGVEKMAMGLEEGGPVDEPFWNALVTFLESFADHHHRKEEEALFPALVARAAGVGELLRELTEEHADFRTRVATLRRTLEGADAATIARAAGGYAFLTREHLQRENLGVYPVAQEVLDDKSVEELTALIEELDTVRLAEGGRTRWILAGRDLCRLSRVDFHGPRG
jgi:hemerythrin-like domain-containing protein